MKFSIVTPSLDQSTWLRLCIASVADQGVDAEHIVQDGGSEDGTQGWLPDDARVRSFVEADSGMYDAVNRGLRRARGEILAYLNCDEQYLPGALACVQERFDREPELDVLFGDAVIVDNVGDYLFHRKMLTPKAHHTWLCQLSTLTCGTFFRRRLLEDWKLYFDPTCPLGDAEWMLRLLRRGVRMSTLGSFTSVFASTGDNLSVRLRASDKDLSSFLPAPRWLRLLRPAIVAHHRVRRLLGGVYRSEPFAFESYSPHDDSRRVRRYVDRPDFRWGAW